MSTTFHNPINNVSTTVGSAYTAHSGSLVVVTGTGAQFGSTFPLIITASQAGSVLSILNVTGRSSDTLTISGAIEGTTDVNLAAGVTIDMRPTALAITEIQTAISSFYDGTNILVTGGTITAQATSGGDFVALNPDPSGAGPAFAAVTTTSGRGAYASLYGGYEAWINFKNLSNSTGQLLCRLGAGHTTNAFQVDLLNDAGTGIVTEGIILCKLAAPASSLVVNPSGALTIATCSDANAENGTIYFGSDHSGELCRKDSGGTVHVIG